MKTTGKIVVISMLVCVAMVAGCSKEIKVTIMNHSDQTRTLQLTVPDGTQTIGAVSPDGSLTYKMKIKNDDLPAQCNLSAGAGSSLSFTVTDDSPGKWWFHISNSGRITGPLGEKDVHTETEETVDIEIKVDSEMIVK